MINVEVEQHSNENAMGVIRRFTKKVQGSGVLPRVRGLRYYSRPNSEALKKKRALKSIARKEKFQELVKLGKISEKPVRRGRRR